VGRVIAVKGLTKSFGHDRVLKGLDLEVGEGEIFGLIGPSGSGKSTLLRTLTGYLSPTEGEAEVLGRAPRRFTPKEEQRVGFMPQGFVLYPRLSVRQNLAFVAGLYGLGFAERRRRVREALEFVELWEHRRKAAADVSGGMQRRLQLASAVVHGPELLFVDEPTANLDPILRRRFWEEFASLRDEGKTLFVTTQYVGEAELCDRVGLLVDGRFVAVGTPEELRRRAFGGEMVELSLVGDPAEISGRIDAIRGLGRAVEVGQDEDTGGSTSRVRLRVDDADRELPGILEALRGVDVRSADLPKASFDEVFFRLVRDSQAEQSINAAG